MCRKYSEEGEKEMSKWLRLASFYAKDNSGCTKVSVGSAIEKDGKLISLGANKTDLNLCKSVRGCLRVELYGENSKDHRLPSDCRAIHSEIDAIASARTDLTGATIYVTRYPCEACARAIISAGIARVVYGRETRISAQTERLFEFNDVVVWHSKEYKEDDNVG
jgi:dCMP deaminase